MRYKDRNHNIVLFLDNILNYNQLFVSYLCRRYEINVIPLYETITYIVADHLDCYIVESAGGALWSCAHGKSVAMAGYGDVCLYPLLTEHLYR